MRLSKLVEGLEKEVFFAGDWEREIQSLTTDSREKHVASLYFALEGKKDGHAYIREAVQNGAVAVVCRKKSEINVPQILVDDVRGALAILSGIFYGEPSRFIKVIGITGTNGKTTTSYMLASILEKAGHRVGVIGTLGIRYDGQEYNNPLTTPDPVLLQKTLAEMHENGVEYAVMEVSAHALYYKKVAGVRFCACIFSNLTQDHLDFFPSMQAYGEAKKSLFLAETCPFAVLNADDEQGMKWLRMRDKERAKSLTYGLKAPADAFAVILEERIYETRCIFNVQDEMLRVRLPFLGIHNVYNALSATACALGLGVDTFVIEKAFEEMHSVQGRLQRITDFRGGSAFVDFAHTPDGLRQSLSTLKKHCKGNLICVFGCGGNRDKSKRPVMGKVVAELSDFAVLTSDNPRFEDPLDIIADIEGGFREISSKYVVIPKRDTAIEYAMERMSEGDILLVAGKGGEKEQEIMGIKYPFEDNAIIERFAVLQKQKNVYEP